MRILGFPFHPILLSIYPVLYLYARNIAFIPPGDASRSLFISLGLTGLLFVGFRIILKRWETAGVLCSSLILLFFSFGHAVNLLSSWLSQININFSVQTFAWVWGGLFFLGAYFLLRVDFSGRPTQSLNLLAVTLVLFPGITIISTGYDRYRNSLFETEQLAELRGEGLAEAAMSAIPDSEKPDIYYIIFDAYERADHLEQYFGYDNSAFHDELQARDFYVVSSSRSNYLTTTYSLNTSLNMIYFHEVPAAIFKQARYNLYTNYVNDFLRGQGYQVVVFDSGTGDSNYQYADQFLSSPAIQTDDLGISPFELLLLRTTLGLLLFESAPRSDQPEAVSEGFIANINRELDIRRERIRFAFDELSNATSDESPTFVFAHIYLPHIPFLYGPDGEALQYHGDLNMFWYEVKPENYEEFYIYQVEYLNRAVLETIDQILAGKSRPTVIILQSDHGDEKFLDWDNPNQLGVDVRSAILNAIYYSDGEYETLYQTMTPVNSFRVTLNHWFGTDYPMLPDKVFFHQHPVNTPSTVKPEFIDACKHFNICLPEVLE